MDRRRDAPGTPPIIAMDPLGAFWTSWLKGVELGLAWSVMWQNALSGAARLGQVNVTLNFPFANGFTQTIDPATNWGWISRQATAAPEVETEVVRDVASYGTQIDKLMTLTLDLAERAGDGVDADKRAAVRRLNDEIEKIKTRRGR